MNLYAVKNKEGKWLAPYSWRDPMWVDEGNREVFSSKSDAKARADFSVNGHARRADRVVFSIVCVGKATPRTNTAAAFGKPGPNSVTAGAVKAMAETAAKLAKAAE